MRRLYSVNRQISSMPDLCTESTIVNAIFLGGAMGFAYEEGLEEAERRKLEKKMNDKTDKKDDV